MAKPNFAEKDRHLTIYDFFPLKGDPTIQEQIEAAKQYEEEEHKQIVDMLREYRKNKKLKV